MLLAVPSKGRAGKTPTLDVLPSATLFVPHSERDDYRKAARPLQKIEAVPDTVRGIVRTRNWILEQAADQRIVWIDDDVKTAGWIRMYPFRTVHRTLPESGWLFNFERAFDLTEELGLSIWGLTTDSAARGCYPYHPILFRSYVTASLMGMFRDRDRFDESFEVKEDYELCLRCIRRDGGVLAIRYLYWENTHWITPGGCFEYRTQAMENAAIRELMRRYPEYVRRVTRGGSGYSIELDF